MNDIQSIVAGMSEIWRDERSKYHLTLGQAIKKLKSIPGHCFVKFDHDGLYPRNEHSYRGYYSDLALESSDEPITVSDLLSTLRLALGKTYGGYKGGDYVMGEDTPLWNAAYGDCGRAIMGMDVMQGGVIIFTKEID
jgi:hypothetical protein